MALPDSIKAIGEQLDAGAEVAPTPELFEAYDVFAAELAHIFTRPWLAVDHASRLAADGDFVRADIGSRSVVLVRDNNGRVHALRNACLHAGYRVCEEEAGRAEHLYCQYHGWSYSLDGRLTDPMLRPEMTDRSRFRLARYPMQIEGGLIFVDLSQIGAEPPPATPIDLSALPGDLGERGVGRRQRYKTTCNWKQLRQFVWGSPGLAFGGGSCDGRVEIGPLSLLATRGGDAALLRLIPRYPGQTELELIEMPASGASPRAADAADPLGDALREEADSIAAAPLSREFFPWYWSHMPAEEA